MQALVIPILLYAGCVLGAIGVALALPRRGLSPQIIGALVAALGLGIIFLALGGRSGLSGKPNVNFYLFALIALGGAVRVISHPRPVYSALYFILTVLASCGLYVLLSAEFLAFALVIVYAGAILITYLFVLMLATEAPTADRVEALSDYDRYSREPIIATVIGFLLVAGLTTMMARGTASLHRPVGYSEDQNLALLSKRVDTALRAAGLMAADESIARVTVNGTSQPVMTLVPATGPASVTIAYGQGGLRTITSDSPSWPKDLALTNTEGVGIALLAEHPGGIEVAGVILLMAMLGAVVLARKKVDLDDADKLAAQGRSLADEFTAEASPLMAPDQSEGPPVREDVVRVIKGEASSAAGARGSGRGNGFAAHTPRQPTGGGV